MHRSRALALRTYPFGALCAAMPWRPGVLRTRDACRPEAAVACLLSLPCGGFSGVYGGSDQSRDEEKSFPIFHYERGRAGSEGSFSRQPATALTSSKRSLKK
ncbi:hypothetical protein V6N11_075537 [Hibiscus sabdariffa]|uniref:Secreted protein n=1 Tax=Hibiscus sabdariffa TaxID=183260 RepID=A0ABR2R6S9_9ROSI